MPLSFESLPYLKLVSSCRKCEILSIAADSCVSIQQCLADIDQKGLFQAFSGSFKTKMVYMTLKEAFTTFVDRIAAIFHDYSNPEGSKGSKKPSVTIRIPLSFEHSRKYLEGVSCIRTLSELFCQEICSLIHDELQRLGLTLSIEEVREETMAIRKAVKNLESFLSARVHCMQGIFILSMKYE